MEKFNKPDLIVEGSELTVEEANGSVGNSSIIGRIKGQFFVPDGTSRNKRFYPRTFWENVLSKPVVKERLDYKQMLGTLGHKQPIDEQAIADEKIAIITESLYINEANLGIGEALILNTKSGRAFKVLADAGMKFFVSSRATGSFKGKHNNMPVVNHEDYNLRGFDIVLDPGFLEANPELVEAYNEIVDEDQEFIIENSSKHDKEKNMEKNMEQVIQRVTEEKLEFKNKLEEAASVIENYKSENITLSEENIELKEAAKNHKEVSEEFKSLKESLEGLGTIESITEAFEVSKKMIESYKAVGSVEDLTSMKESFDKINEELGSPEKIKEALTASKESLDNYSKLGTPSQIEEALKLFKTSISEVAEADKKSKLEAVAKELGVSMTQIEHFGVDRPVEEIRVFFLEMMESVKEKIKYTADDVDVNEDKEKDNKDTDESKSLFEGRASASNIMNSLM